MSDTTHYFSWGNCNQARVRFDSKKCLKIVFLWLFLCTACLAIFLEPKLDKTLSTKSNCHHKHWWFIRCPASSLDLIRLKSFKLVSQNLNSTKSSLISLLRLSPSSPSTGVATASFLPSCFLHRFWNICSIKCQNTILLLPASNQLFCWKNYCRFPQNDDYFAIEAEAKQKSVKPK